MNSDFLTISVVSHNQNHLVRQLLDDIHGHLTLPFEVILTSNIKESFSLELKEWGFPISQVINENPKGFSENHNAAFDLAKGNFFCVLNPDIRLTKDPFPSLLACLKSTQAGVVGPIIVGPDGTREDSARQFPTPFRILCKAFGGCKGSDYTLQNEPIFPDWVGGMFMLFPRNIFQQLGGFNQRFFLYYEDVDLCARLRLQGYSVAICPDAQVVHHARRSSHRNFKYLKWHLTSMMRFFCSLPFLKICWLRLKKKYL